MNPTQQVQKAEKKLTLKDHLQSLAFRNEVAKALPKHCTVDRQMRAMLSALTRIPKLMECDQHTFFSACLTLSQLGLEPDGRRAHLIPYGKTVQLIIDYKGIVELVMRSGVVSYIHADIVCDHDVFKYNRGHLEEHAIDFRAERGEMYAVYALCKFKDGSEKCEVMTKAEVDAIRKRSKASGSGPWVTDYNEMAKKTVFRRLSKWLPFSPEQRDVIEADDEVKPAIEINTEDKRPVFEIPAETLPNDPDPIAGNPANVVTLASAETPFPELIKTLDDLMAKDSVSHDQLMAWAVKQKLAKDSQSKEDLSTKKLADIINGWEAILPQVKG